MKAATLRTADGKLFPITHIWIEGALLASGDSQTVVASVGGMVVRRDGLSAADAAGLVKLVRAGGKFDENLNQIEP